ncbi:MAG: pyridoxal phosphate-dependent aminotransferase [Candidatus Calescibacterium sp.]|jgi:aspartate aminotransferase
MELSKRVKEIKPSPTLSLDAKAKELISKGEDIISFGAGEPDFPSPDEACEWGKRAIDQGKTKYTAVDGIPELKKAVAKRFENFFGVKYDVKEIIVTPGAKMAIYEALFSLVDEGDEVIILSPYWVSYPDMVKMVGGIPKFVETKPENNFEPDPDDIANAISSRTKVLILNFPCNPTGAVASPDVFKEIAKIVSKRDVFVISDEIYGTLVYDGVFESFARFLKEKTLVIWGMSKTYSMTGWRIGFGLGPEKIISAMRKVQSQTTSNPTTISQYASLAALEEESQKFVRETTEKFKQRRDLIFNLLCELGIKCVKPRGAFYIFPDVSEFLGGKVKTTDELSDFLLGNCKVLVIPGSGFGAEGFIRLSFALSEEKIKEGVKRIKEGLSSLKG